MEASNRVFVLRKRPQIWKILIFLPYFVGALTVFICFNFVVSVALFSLFFMVLFADSICWQLMGKEIVEIEQNHIVVYKRGRILQQKHTISGKAYCICQKEAYSFWTSYGLFFSTRGGSVKMIDDNMMEFYFGQSLTSDEAAALSDFIAHYNENQYHETPDVLMKFVRNH